MECSHLVPPWLLDVALRRCEWRGMQDAKVSNGPGNQHPPAERGPMHSQQARPSAIGRSAGVSQRPTSPLSPCSNGTVDVSEELRSPPQLLSSPEVGGPSMRQTVAAPAAAAKPRKHAGAGGKARAKTGSAPSQEWDDLEAELAGGAPSPKK